MMMPKIGFCCKWIDRADQVDGVRPNDDAKKYNTGTTTLAWMNRQTVSTAEDRLWSLVKQNIEACRLLVQRVAALPETLRMVRLSSDCLPLYTEPKWSYFYRQPDVIAYMERHFAAIGAIARQCGVRLSFHPGQFTCIVSDKPAIVDSSIRELEYHADMAKWMGYGKSRLDFKINIHLSGKNGSDAFDAAWNRMSPELRMMLTLENDEYQAGLDDLIVLKDRVAIVLDIHHHYIHSKGEYIAAGDDRIQDVIESWAGVRPVFHYSQSRSEYTVGHDSTLPDYSVLVETHNNTKLRAHSDFYHNRIVNSWALSHLAWGDCMAEAKGKNLASYDLYQQYINGNI